MDDFDYRLSKKKELFQNLQKGIEIIDILVKLGNKLNKNYRDKVSYFLETGEQKIRRGESFSYESLRLFLEYALSKDGILPEHGKVFVDRKGNILLSWYGSTDENEIVFYPDGKRMHYRIPLPEKLKGQYND